MLFLLLSPFIMLAPVIWRVNTFPVEGDYVYIAERFLYAPAMLFFLFVSALTVKLFKDVSKEYLIIGWALIMAAFIIITITSNNMWKNNLILFEKITEKSPDAVSAHNNLGLVYAGQSRFDEAIKEYLTAIRIKSDYAAAYTNLGLAYASQGRFDEAIREYKIALTFKPDIALIHNNLGNAYFEQGRFDGAISEYEIALKLKPANADIHYNLGLAYYKKGLIDEARKEFEIVLKLKPDFTKAQKALKTLK